MSRRVCNLIVALVLGLSGCHTTPASCSCPPGNACDADGACHLLCSRSSDCLDSTNTCVDGLCIAAGSESCYLDSDCQARAVCHVAGRCNVTTCDYPDELLPVGTTCDDGDPCTSLDACDASGTCKGTPIVCDEPPVPSCIENDGIYVDYLPRGSCDSASGTCTYTPRRTTCTGCAANCLVVCAGVICNDDQGGCRPNGICTPGADPLCQYGQATDGTRCDRPGSATGTHDGVCKSGGCVECIVPQDCQSPPGDAECFTGSCSGSSCSYSAQPGRTCLPQSCTGGVVTSPRSCDASGACPDAGTRGCNGFACSGPDCLTSCTGSAQCVGSLTCDVPTGKCLGQKSDGDSCIIDAECQHTCIGGLCAPRAGLGGACDTPPDCNANLTCLGGVCRGNNGQGCSANGDCLNTCVAGTCVQRPSTLGACDDTPDCPASHTCTSGTCRKISGQGCGNGPECASNACVSGHCCESDCSGVCQSCASDGHCNVTPADDSRCAVVDCTTLSSSCRTYSGTLSSNRCASFGTCKSANATYCTTYADLSASTVCRASSGAACDIADTCTGSGACGPDVYAPKFTVCHPATGYCNHTAEVCPGDSLTCPADGYAWQYFQMCTGGALSTQTPMRGSPPAATSGLFAIASGRQNVTADDQAQCQLFCDQTPDVNCCVIFGFNFCIKSSCTPEVWCEAYAGATGLAAYTGTGSDVSFAGMCN